LKIVSTIKGWKKGGVNSGFPEQGDAGNNAKADTWKEQMGYYRFWENKKVTEEELKECAVKQCAEQ
jgi:hypothetical protein